jgi:hypothetical protein
MSFFYNRQISISRIQPAQTAGPSGYRAPLQAIEEQIFSGLQVNAREAGRGGQPLADVPADVVGRTMWRFVFPLGSTIPPGAIRKDDIITDDLGRRFKALAPDWKSANGIQIMGELLVS